MPIKTIDIHDLHEQLDDMLSAVRSGAVVVLSDADTKVARIVPVSAGEVSQTITTSIANFVETLRTIHKENSSVEHFMKIPNSGEEPTTTMYLTPFIYEFFLYNSLYQIDWHKSLGLGRIEAHTFNNEEDQQNAFEDFLREKSKASPDLICKAFGPLSIMETQGDWTRIVPDSRIRLERGDKFFGDLTQLQNRLKRLCRQPTSDLHNEAFNYIFDCRLFVYKVRCNIFHGRKTIHEAYEPGQDKRIEVYYRFLNCLVSLFFEVMYLMLHHR